MPMFCITLQNIKKVLINSYPKHGWARYPAWCWKTHSFPCFCVWWWTQVVAKWPPRALVISGVACGYEGYYTGPRALVISEWLVAMKVITLVPRHWSYLSGLWLWELLHRSPGTDHIWLVAMKVTTLVPGHQSYLEWLLAMRVIITQVPRHWSYLEWLVREWLTAVRNRCQNGFIWNRW